MVRAAATDIAGYFPFFATDNRRVQRPAFAGATSRVPTSLHNPELTVHRRRPVEGVEIIVESAGLAFTLNTVFLMENPGITLTTNELADATLAEFTARIEKLYDVPFFNLVSAHVVDAVVHFTAPDDDVTTYDVAPDTASHRSVALPFPGE